MMNKKESFINILAALATFFVQLVISFWLSPFVVSRLGEEAFGFINLSNNFVAYASLLAVALNSMANRYISIEYNSGKSQEAREYFYSVFIANCFLFLIIIIGAIAIIYKLEYIVNISENLIYQVKIVFFLSFLNMGISLIGTVYTAAAYATNKMHYSSAVVIVSNVIRSIIILLLFIILPPKVYYLAIATLVAGIVAFIGHYLVTKKLLPDFSLKRKYFNISKILQLIKSGAWMLLSNVSNLLLNGFDLLLTNWFVSNVIMGRLSLAKQLPYALSSALGVFSNIFSASLTKTFSIKGNKEIISDAKSQLRILTFIFTVPYAGIIAVGPSFLRLWLKEASYSDKSIRMIYFLMVIILLDIIVSTYMYSIHSVFIALDKVKNYSLVLLIASILSIVTTCVLLKTTSLGVYCIAGTSTVILGITHGIIVPAMAAKLLDAKIWVFWTQELLSWILLVVLSGIFAVASIGLRFNSWGSFLLSICFLAIVGYMISFFLVLKKDERKQIINFIRIKTKNMLGN